MPRGTMGIVLDPRLVGYWSDQDLYQGAMEAADIAFRPDGAGWTYWSRDGGTFYVDRFRWHTTADNRLILDVHEKLFGTWDLEGHTTRHHVDSQAPSGKQLVLAYQITAGQDSFKRPATLLELDQPINVATIGDRFAFHRELTRDEQDPTTRTP
jgi:hypothetical protein